MIPTCELSSREHHFDAVRYKVGWVAIVAAISRSNIGGANADMYLVHNAARHFWGMSMPWRTKSHPLQVPASIRLTLNNTGVSLAQFRFIPKVNTDRHEGQKLCTDDRLCNQVHQFM